MTTAAHAKQFLKPLLERHLELLYSKRCVIDSPVRHYIRYVIIDRSSDPTEFVPYWNVYPLYFGAESLGVRWFAGNIRHPSRVWWKTLDSLETEQFAAMAEPLLAEMRRIDTPEAYIAFERLDNPPHLNSHEDLEIPHRLVAGHLDRARDLLASPRRWTWHLWKPKLEAIGVWDSLLRQGAGMPAGDRKRLADYFHARERRSVEALKIQPIWAPTPFPLETDAL